MTVLHHDDTPAAAVVVAAVVVVVDSNHHVPQHFPPPPGRVQYTVPVVGVVVEGGLYMVDEMTKPRDRCSAFRFRYRYM